jgi:hypothetical protein
MAKQKILVLTSILAIAGAAAWIYYHQPGAPQRFELGPYQALGYGTGEETAKLLGKKGGVVVVAPDSSQSPNPAVDGELSSFQEALRKNGLTVVEAVRFKLTPQERMGTGGAIPADQFHSLLRRHANVGAVVLFCAFPPLAGQDYEAIKQSPAKMIVASGYLPGYRRLLETRVIHLAIVPRFDRTSSPARTPQTLREWFESDFAMFTTDNLATLPY